MEQLEFSGQKTSVEESIQSRGPASAKAQAIKEQASISGEGRESESAGTCTLGERGRNGATECLEQGCERLLWPEKELVLYRL